MLSSGFPTALAPWLVLVAVLVYGLVHSLLAGLRAKTLAWRYFGGLSDRFYRLVYNLIAVVSLLPMLALPALLPDHTLYSIPFPWTLLNIVLQGLALLALGVGLIQTGVWSFLGLRQLLVRREVEKSELAIKGMYRWVRHPIYTAGLAFIWFTPLMTVNVLALNLGLTIYIVVGAYVEERKLMLEFGEAYQYYRRHTPMLFPHVIPSRLFKSEAR